MARIPAAKIMCRSAASVTLDLYAGQLSQGMPLRSLPAQTLQVG